jgi:hypothetical protein
MKKTILTTFVLAIAFLLSGTVSYAQSDTQEYDKYLNLLRKDLRSAKKQLVAANMTLTDAEAIKFWTVYDQYTAELMKLYDARLVLIKEYAANQEKLTDDQAKSLNKRSIDNDESFTRLRQKYVPLISKVLPGKKAALFFQIDKRISLLMDLQVASEVPLVEL